MVNETIYKVIEVFVYNRMKLAISRYGYLGIANTIR
jgi:hypothetical protein